MKLLIASDLHGSAYYTNKLIDAYNKESPDKLLLLGDILYHGPRNDLPLDYSPKRVIAMLNSISENIICVKGNCDCEVDEMVLNFPVLADYAIIFDPALCGKSIFATHGHRFNASCLPKLKKGDILLHGHTHITCFEKFENVYIVNPGSVSIPKNETLNSYMILENGIFTLKDIEGNTISVFNM